MHLADADPAVLVALAGAVKPKDLAAAKADLPEQSSRSVRFVAEVSGLLTKGTSTPGGEGTKPAAVSLCTAGILLAVLRQLGVGPTRMGKALSDVLSDVAQPADLDAIGRGGEFGPLRLALEEAATDLNAKLPEQPWTSNGRAATVRFDPTLVHILEDSCQLKAAA